MESGRGVCHLKGRRHMNLEHLRENQVFSDEGAQAMRLFQGAQGNEPLQGATETIVFEDVYHTHSRSNGEGAQAARCVSLFARQRTLRRRVSSRLRPFQESRATRLT